MTTATVNNSKMVWEKQKDEHGETFYATDDDRYKVYQRRKDQWVPTWLNPKDGSYDWVKNEVGKANSPVVYSKLKAALEAAEDFHEQLTGITIRVTNREKFTDSSSHAPTASVKSTVSKPVKESANVTKTAPAVLSVPRDAVVELCVELGWLAAKSWPKKKMKGFITNRLPDALTEEKIAKLDEETLGLANKLNEVTDEGGDIILEGDFPDEDFDEPTPEASTNGKTVTEETPDGGDSEAPAPKKRGRPKKVVLVDGPADATPAESEETNEDEQEETPKKKGKRSKTVEPVNTQEVLELCQPEELSLADLKVDRTYQRPVIESHVKKILKKWNPIALTALIVGQREDGSYWTVDGLQRSDAMKRRGMLMAHCMVFKSEGPKHEAHIFDLVNAGRKAPSKVELFNAEYTAGESEPVEITRIVKENGFTFGKPAQTWPKLDCVQALRKVYRKGKEELLSLTLNTIKEAWDGDVTACREFIVFGLGDFLHRYQGLVNVEKLIAVLKKVTPEQIVGEAESRKKLMGGSRHLVLGMFTVGKYNKMYKSKKDQLPDRYIGAEPEGPRSED